MTKGSSHRNLESLSTKRVKEGGLDTLEEEINKIELDQEIKKAK